MRQPTSSWRANKRGAIPLVPEGPMAVRLKKFAGSGTNLPGAHCPGVSSPRYTPANGLSVSPGAGVFFSCLGDVCLEWSGDAAARVQGNRTGIWPRELSLFASVVTFSGGGQLWVLEKVLCFGCLACRCRSFCCWRCFGTIEDDEPCSSPRMRVVSLSRTRGGRPNSGNRRRVEKCEVVVNSPVVGPHLGAAAGDVEDQTE
jgi:hypothetical protein